MRARRNIDRYWLLDLAWLQRVTLCLLLCGGTRARAEAGERPAWGIPASASRFPAQSYLVGLGQCGPDVAASERLRCAREHAAEEIALAVSARVDARRERVIESTITRRDAGVQAEVQARVVHSGSSSASVQLEELRVIEQVCSEERQACYVLAVVQRAAFIQRLRRKHEARRQVLESALASAESAASALDRIEAAERARRAIDELDDIASLIAAIGRPSDAPALQAAQAHARRLHALSGISLCLTTDSTLVRPSVVFERARAALAEAGISKITLSEPGACQLGALRIELELRLDQHSTQSLVVIDVSGALSFRDDARTLAGSRAVHGHGVARSPARSQDDAEARLALAVEQAVRETLLAAAREP